MSAQGSRFWLGNGDDSDDDEGFYSSGSDNEEEGGKVAASRFTFDSDDEEETKRVVRSAKDKIFDEFQQSIKKCRHSMNINDWSKIQTEWENMTKVYDKSKAVIEKDGIPRFLLKIMANIEDLMIKTLADKELVKKKMSSTNSKSLNNVKQKFRKWTKTNAAFEKALDEYKKNPDKEDEEEEKAAAADKGKAAPATNNAAKTTTKADDTKKGGAAKKQMSDDEGSDVDGDDDGDDEEPKPEQQSSANKTLADRRSYWLKKPGEESSDDDDDDEDASWMDDDEGDGEGSDEDGEGKKGTKKGGKKGAKKGGKKGGKEPKAPAAGTTKPEPTPKPEDKKPEPEKKEEWNAEKIDKKVKELLSKRGTKNYDRLKQVQQFQYLIEKTTTVADANVPERILRILFHLVDAQFDANPNMATHMTIAMWKSCFNTIVKILELLKKNPHIELVDSEPELEVSVRKVGGHLLSAIERLNDEFVKSLQFMDPHTQDYLQRLRDEIPFLRLARYAQEYFESTKDIVSTSYIAARRLDHLYYKRDKELNQQQLQVAIEKSLQQKTLDTSKSASGVPQQEKDIAPPTLSESSDGTVVANPVVAQIPEVEEALILPPVPEDLNLIEIVESICRIIYKSKEDKLKRRAVLQQIYHLALHDKFFEARDLMLMSHLQDSISLADVSTQVLYNRALSQLGLAAFRKGRIVDAHTYLAEIVSLGKMKELLAQGINTKSYNEKTPEQEKLERRRQIPYPMHINLELLECVSLVSAMLLEVPNIAANPFDPKKRIISKNFRKVMDFADRQVFSGPPENTREHIIAASKALAKGDHVRCSELLLKLEIWRLFPKQENVKAMLKRKIQEEGLRTYLFTFGQFYDSIKLSELSEMFQLPPNIVHAIASKMMLSEELRASWDQPAGAIVMHKADASKLQYLALQFADKAAVLVESGDNAEPRQGGYKDRWPEDGRKGGQGQYNQRNQQYSNRNQRGNRPRDQNYSGGDNKRSGSGGMPQRQVGSRFQKY